MSIAGKLAHALVDGQSIGCTAIQIFTHSNRQWKIPPFKEEAVQEFKLVWQQTNIQSVVVHASYLLNIGSADKAIQKRSAQALIEELRRCALLDIPYLILHPGSAARSTPTASLEAIANNLDEVLETVPGKTMILLENMAGQGAILGASFEELALIRTHAHHKTRIGYCFDTCHAFAAGYDFRTPATYKNMWQQFDDILGLQHLKTIHLNDSKKELGSRVDRHEDIGKGALGLEAFRLLMHDAALAHIPKILETPLKEGLQDYVRNLNVLNEL